MASTRNTVLDRLVVSSFPVSFKQIFISLSQVSNQTCPRRKMQMLFYFSTEKNSIYWNFCFLSSLIKLGFRKESYFCRGNGVQVLDRYHYL